MRIRKRILPSGAIRYEVDFGLVQGRRRRILCRTRREATAVLAKIKKEMRVGLAQRIIDAFADVGVLARHSSVPLVTVIEELLRSLQRKNRSQETIRGIKNRLTVFARRLGFQSPIEQTTTADIELFLRQFSGRNRQNYFRALRQLYRYAMQHGYASHDPVASIDPPTHRPPLPRIFSAAEVEALLAAADQRIVPWLAVQVYAGLRPNEAALLDWSAVDLEGQTILVLPDTSKVRRARYVSIGQKLISILRKFARPAGPIAPKRTCREELKLKACEKAGLRWSHDVLRHTYATMRIACGDLPAQVAVDMGTSETMIWRHYRGLARKSEAIAFWAESPPGP